jgi:16S rRNA (uracil1498-N3)-methyltransferase
MTKRRWIAESWDDATATLKGDQAHHLARVLRAEKGAEFDVLAGEQVWRAAITSVADDQVVFDLLEAVASTVTLQITVLLSVFKFDRFEWALEKLTELGVARIEPVIARRTEKHLGQSAANRIERWRRIAFEAAKQSRRSSVPAIDTPLPLAQALATSRGSDIRLLFAEEEKRQTLLHALETLRSHPSGDDRKILLAVGPEGGWSPEELALFGEHSWQPVSLGGTILRAETAAMMGVSVVAAWLQG